MPENSSVAVIRSKLYRPIVANDIIERRRLLELASNAEGNSVTLVSAQAGCGKSTLVSQWLNDSDIASAWLSLGPADGNLAQFLAYVVAAIRTIFPDSCQEISEYLQMTAEPSPEEMAGVLINDLDNIDKRFTLVLDDYHHLGDSLVHDFLDCMLLHPPQVLHLVLITRRDPPLSLQPLRAGGVLTEIRMQDLLFTEAESYAFIRKRLGDEVSQEAISILHRATDGWPVGIRLATLAAPEPSAIDSFAQKISGDIREVRDYLVTEVLAQQSAAVRDGLLRTSFLDRFNAPLCGAVVNGSIGGEEFLCHVRESGLLSIALDSDEEWFRYHHLFQSMLQSQAGDELDESAISDVHLQASGWFESQGYLDEAIRHMIASGNASAAGEIVVRHRNQIMNLEQLERIGPWLELLPADMIEESPGLLLVRARIQQTIGTLDEAWQTLDEVDRVLKTRQLDSSRRLELSASVASLRCYQHYTASNPSSTIESAEFALQHLPEECFAERGFAVNLMVGGLHMIGRYDVAKNIIYDALAVELPTRKENKTHRVRLFISLSFINWMNADLSGLRTSAKELADTFDSNGLAETFAISCFFRGTAQYHSEELQAASLTLDRMKKHRSVSNIRFYAQCAFISALAMQEQGQVEEANAVARFTLEFALKHRNKSMILHAEAFLAELALRQGRTTEALAWAQSFDPGPFVPMYVFYSPLITLAKVLVADDSEQSRNRALSFLNELADYLASTHNKRFEIEVLAIRAMLFEVMRDREAATRDLTRAVSMAMPGRFIRLFVDLGPRLANLLGLLNLNEESLVYVGEILAAFRQLPESDGSPSGSRAVTINDAQFTFDPLSKREQQILTYLAGRLSNKEIADELYISVVTVKRHAANIYQKLGVHDRRKAVAKATGLGLIR